MRLSIILIASLALLSCSTVRFDKKQVLWRNNDIASLEERVKTGINHEIDILAPRTFDHAVKMLEQAISAAQKSSDLSAGTEFARQGLVEIEKAENAARNSRKILNDTLKARRNAKTARADLLFDINFNKLEKELKVASLALEEGNQKKGLEENAVLAKEYASLEIKSLKINISEVAERAYQQALSANALKLAPITMKSAKDELAIAKRIIDVEKDNYEKAQYHAERARYLAMRAKYIADIVTGFKKEKLTEEQLVLWYQDKLQEANRPLNPNIRFDYANKDVLAAIAGELSARVSNLKGLEQRANTAEERASELAEELIASDARARAHDEILRELSIMFSEDQAEVLKREEDIIIRSYGFQFKVGQAELLASNFDLLNKIVRAIKKFPHATILVEGHTDSTGSEKINLNLSSQRAKNIAEYLVKVANIDGSRVSYIGLGYKRPIATEVTAEDRAKNRRIEVIIKN